MNEEETRREIAFLESLRAQLTWRIQTLRSSLKAEKPEPTSNGRKNSIEVEKLKPFLQQWIDQGHTLVSLADFSGVDESHIGKIMRGKQQWVTTAVADKLLTAIGMQHRYNELDPYGDIES